MPPEGDSSFASVAMSALVELLETSAPDPNPKLWNGRPGLRVAPDGLPAREVKAHNAHKAHYIRGYSDIFSRAMKNKWEFRCYLDLYCGPGVCWVKDTGRFVLGSPLIAMNVDAPFTHLTFNDLDEDCTEALQRRVGASHAEVAFFNQDANDRAALDEIRMAIPHTNALSLALLDPQGMDLNLDTIRCLTTGKRMDLLINLPIHSLWRCLRKGDTPVLDRVLGEGWPTQITNDWRAAVRKHFHEKLASIGFGHHEAKQVWSEAKKSPLYDFILYSHVELAIKFFKHATRTDASRQQPLFA